MPKFSRVLSAISYHPRVNTALLVLRVGTSLLMLPHGWNKFNRLSQKPVDFYNFLGLGDELSLLLIIFAEFFCSILLILGIATRAVVIPLIIGMLVIICMVHGDDPFRDKEHGLLFLVPYIVLFITGPGKYSLDYLFFGKK